MLSPTAALAWEIWRRHRIGLAGVFALVAGVGVLAAIEPLSPNAAAAHSLWFGVGISYVIGVFTYGFEAKLESPESGFPARFFVLPVRTGMLVGAPMLQGVLVAVLLWLGWEQFVLRPSGIETPSWWAAMLAATVALCQALVWLPFGVPWLRLFTMIAALSAIVRAPAILVLFGDRYANPETQNATLFAIALGLIPIALLIADRGVKRARRGDTPVWFGAGRADRAVRPQREARAFTSALQAQTWYEWRTRGRGFVVTVVLIIFVIMGVGLLEHSSQRADIGLMFLLIPILIASFWGSQIGSAGTSIRSTAIPAFTATRPLDDTDLATAKRRAATLATIVTWVIVLALTAAWFALNDGFSHLTPVWERAVDYYGLPFARGFCLLVALVLIVGSWRALTANLWVGLSGRTWMVPAHTFLLSLAALQILAEWVMLNADLARRDRLLDWLPCAAGIAVALKLLFSSTILALRQRRSEFEHFPAMRFIVSWTIAAVCLIALLLWLVPSELVPASGLVLGVVLALPLARPLAAPLALGWNRHR
jgi:hypothetical protein